MKKNIFYLLFLLPALMFQSCLKDQEDNVIEEKKITLKELANLLNDPNILQCVNAAILEFYLFAQHMRTTIKGEEYRHKGYSVGFNQLPTYEFVKV